MAYRYFPDSNGATIKWYEDDGRLTHIPIPQWNALTQLTSRHDDVMLCTYPRSGTHWVWEILHMLKNGDTELTSLDMKSHILILNQPSDLDALPSPRVLATHRQFQELPSDFIIKKRKLILVVRDPKDVCVSTYHLCLSAEKTSEYKGTFDGYISLFLQGRGFLNSWSRWILSYEKGLKEHPEIPYHVVHYEKLKETPVKEIGRLAEFLGVDPRVADTAAEKTSFSAMRDFKTKTEFGELAQFFDDSKPNANFFRKGQSGSWKEWFNEEQVTHFNNTICEQLGRTSIQPLL